VVVENVDFTAYSISRRHQAGRRALSMLEEPVSSREFQAAEAI